MSKHIDYIELFSGIGAFSQAISQVDGVEAKCVFAADNDELCAKVYKDNYGIDSLFDLTSEDKSSIPDHDLCFFSPPCQAFSKSGKQLGFEEARGTLIYEVFKILKVHRPKYILMENVRNLESHDNHNTMRVIMESLHDLGYRTTRRPIILSPYQFGIPQTRDRVFLPGIYDPEHTKDYLVFDFGRLKEKKDCSVDSIIDHSFDNDPELKITEGEERVLEMWDAFYKGIDVKTIGFPIWSKYFDILDEKPDMPDWKKDFIRKNKDLYRRNKDFIDKWMVEYDLRSFSDTHQKFEWQAGERIKSVWEGVIQIRPSGVRVKAPTTLPALVAMVQIPIIGKLKRRLSVRECANLQSFPQDFKFNIGNQDAYKQLGNSINVTVLKEVALKLLTYAEKDVHIGVVRTTTLPVPKKDDVVQITTTAPKLEAVAVDVPDASEEDTPVKSLSAPEPEGAFAETKPISDADAEDESAPKALPAPEGESVSEKEGDAAEAKPAPEKEEAAPEAKPGSDAEDESAPKALPAPESESVSEKEGDAAKAKDNSKQEITVITPTEPSINKVPTFAGRIAHTPFPAKIATTGEVYYICIPKDVIDRMNLKVGEEVDVSLDLPKREEKTDS